jgi:hypothetical protein
MKMRVGEFQCIFGSDQAVVKLKFRERISAHEEPDKLQYSLFVSHLASMSMYIVLSFIKLISVHQRWNVLIFGLLIFQVLTAQFAPWTSHFGWTARLK